MTNYPGSSVSTLSSDNSDHTPCLVKISTDIPKARVFRFENCWMLHGDFLQNMEHGWNVPVTQEDRTMKVTAKFKNLRRVLRSWHSQLSNLSATISNNKMVLAFLDNLEEFHDLSLAEWNFRSTV
jgi:hypothetical protein